MIELLAISELTPLQLKELYNSCIRIASSFLRSSYNKVGKNSFSTYEDTNELSVTAITPLFVKDKNGETPLRRAFLNWDKKITDEASAYFFLYQIITSRLEQEIIKKIKENDPFFSKILRSIHYLIDQNRFNKATWFGINYLIEKKNTRITQKPILPESLEDLPDSFFIGNNEKIITNIFRYINDETDYFPAIPLNALIHRIKVTSSGLLKYSTFHFTEEDFQDNIDIDSIVLESLSIINARLHTFYFQKGKLNAKEVATFQSVIKSISNDLKDGGLSRGLYEYFKQNMTDLTREEYYKKYHQILDYLFRIFKKEISTRLEVLS